MTPSEGEGDISSSPEHLLLIGNESSVESSDQDFGDMDQSATIKPVPQTRECEINVRPPVSLASQTLAQDTVGSHQVEPTAR